MQGTPLHLYDSACIQLELSSDKFWVNETLGILLQQLWSYRPRLVSAAKDKPYWDSTNDILPVDPKQSAPIVALDDTSYLNVVLQEFLKIPPHSEVEWIGPATDVAIQKSCMGGSR